MADSTRDGPTSGADGTGDDDATDGADATADANVTDDADADATADANATEQVVETGDVTAKYAETDDERVLTFTREGRTATIVQNATGYAMVKVRTAPAGDELERYYGFDMALDHAAERLGVAVADLPVPEAAADMGM
jgi:hypothetical protein